MGGRTDPRAARAPPSAGPFESRSDESVECRFRGCYARRVCRPSRKPRGAYGLCRVAFEPDALENVGFDQWPACRGCADGRSANGSGRGAGGRSVSHASSRPAASLRSPNGNVALSGKGAEGRRCVAPAGARCRAPDPHANAHRYSVWALPERGGLE